MTKTATIAACALLATTILSTNAKADNAGKYYLSATAEYIASATGDGNLTYSSVSYPGSINYNNGAGGMIALGYYLTPAVRAELEGGYRSIKQDTASITVSGTTYTTNSNARDKASSGMVNMYFDMTTNTDFTPYVGAGIGAAHDSDGGGSTAFAYQGMLGVGYKVSENSSLFAGYRYFKTSDFTFKYAVSGLPGTVTEKVSIGASAIDVGYRFSF